MKKILIITNNWTLGGAEKVIKNIIENISSSDVRFELLIFKKNNNFDHKLIFFPYPCGARIKEIKEKRYYSLFFKLTKFLRDNKFQIILTVIHPTTISFLLVTLAKYLSFSKAKFIISIHNFFRFDYLKTIHRLFLNWAFKKADLIITVSRDLENYTKKIVNKNFNRKIKTVYSPIIDDKIINNFKRKIPQEFYGIDEKIILTVARLDSRQKDFNTLIAAFKIVSEKLSKSKLFIIGGGQDKEKIQSIIDRTNLQNKIFLLGAKYNPYSYLHHSDVFVLSSYHEGLPTVIVEAMACECPVVATDCPTGPKELLGNNKNGLLVPMENPEKMAEAILIILNNQNLRNQLIKNGKRKSREFFITRATQEYRNIFNKIIYPDDVDIL